jgi:glycerol-3-phosphate dehydrogenase
MVNGRAAHWEYAGQEVLDVLIIGGGVNDASLYHELRRHAWRT